MEPSNLNNPVRPDAVDRDLLISRLLDARASDIDWLAFRDFASVDHSVWNDIVATRRDMSRLERGIQSLSASADHCDVPELRFGGGGRAAGSKSGWTSRSGLIGWAVAAALALGFVAQQAGLKTGMEARPQAALVPIPSTAPELLNQYIEEGRKSGLVLGEVPQRMVVETRPRENGQGHEVIFYRLLLERTFVNDDDFRTISAQEDGQKVLVPASAPVTIKTSY